MGNFSTRDVVDDWMPRLSLGEQQRLEIARLILALKVYNNPIPSSFLTNGNSSVTSHSCPSPLLIFLDEATSNVDEEMESVIYSILKELVSVKAGALISVAHRSTVRHFHNRELHIRKDGSHTLSDIS